jgi:hypothetical protein
MAETDQQKDSGFSPFDERFINKCPDYPQSGQGHG